MIELEMQVIQKVPACTPCYVARGQVTPAVTILGLMYKDLGAGAWSITYDPNADPKSKGEKKAGLCEEHKNSLLPEVFDRFHSQVMELLGLIEMEESSGTDQGEPATPEQTPEDDDGQDEEEEEGAEDLERCSECGDPLEDHCEDCGECSCICDEEDIEEPQSGPAGRKVPAGEPEDAEEPEPEIRIPTYDEKKPDAAEKAAMQTWWVNLSTPEDKVKYRINATGRVSRRTTEAFRDSKQGREYWKKRLSVSA